MDMTVQLTGLIEDFVKSLQARLGATEKQSRIAMLAATAGLQMPAATPSESLSIDQVLDRIRMMRDNVTPPPLDAPDWPSTPAQRAAFAASEALIRKDP